MKQFKILAVLLMLCFIAGCAGLGATNTTATNVGVASYESAGVTLAQAYNTEKMLFKAGTITAVQDSQFQLGVYTDAFNCYKAIGSSAVAVITATDATSKATATAKFNSLNAQLPALITNVLTFIQGVSK
jgi:hypothetical protein